MSHKPTIGSNNRSAAPSLGSIRSRQPQPQPRIEDMGTTTSTQTTTMTNTMEEARVARQQLSRLFQEGGFFWRPRHASVERNAAYTHKDMTKLAVHAVKIVDLLRRFPCLASELFEYEYPIHNSAAETSSMGEEGGGGGGGNHHISRYHAYHPLTFFLWNNFDEEMLDFCYFLFPEAVLSSAQLQQQSPNSQPREMIVNNWHRRISPNLLHLACENDFIQDDTLLWLISKESDLLWEPMPASSAQKPSLLPLVQLLRTKRKAGIFGSLRVIQAFLEQGPPISAYQSSSLEKKKKTHLLNQFFALGYGDTVLNYVIDHHLPPPQQSQPQQQDYDTLYLDPCVLEDLQLHPSWYNDYYQDNNAPVAVQHYAPWWEMDIHQAQVVERLLPRLHTIVCNPTTWRVNGWARILNALTNTGTTTTHEDDPYYNLNGASPACAVQVLELTLPIRWLLTHQEGREVLQRFFQLKHCSAPLQKIVLDGCRQAEGNTDRRHFGRANDICFSRILRGLELNQSQTTCTPILQELKLVHVVLPSWRTLVQLGNFVRVMHLERIRIFDPDYNSTGAGTAGAAVTEQQRLQVASLEERSKLKELTMDDFVMSAACSTDLWRHVARMKKLRHVHLRPGSGYSIQECLPAAMLNFARMSHLTSLELEPQYELDWSEADNAVDITAAMVSILEQERSSLRKLRIKAVYIDDNQMYCGPFYRLRYAPICQALQQNTSLEVLELQDVSSGPDDDVLAIPNLFLQVLLQNTTLQTLSAYEGDLVYAPGPTDPLTYYKHVDYHCSRRILYKLWLNRFGRGKLRSKTATVKDLMSLLEQVMTTNFQVGGYNVHDLIDTLTEGNGEQQQQPEQQPESVIDAQQEKQLNHCFTTLLGWQHVLTTVVRRDIDVLGVLYGLLRESPSLCCSITTTGPTTSAGGRRSTRRKRKRG